MMMIMVMIMLGNLKNKQEISKNFRKKYKIIQRKKFKMEENRKSNISIMIITVTMMMIMVMIMLGNLKNKQEISKNFRKKYKIIQRKKFKKEENRK